MRWVGHIAHLGDMINVYKILVGKPVGVHSEDLGIGGKVILEWILVKLGGKVWFRTGTSARLL
jgi:hypothetical protein